VEENVRYSGRLFLSKFFRISSTQLPFLAHLANLSRSCKSKTSVLGHTGTNLSTCGARQISPHSTSSNTPQWSLIPCTMLQETIGFSNMQQRIPSGRATYKLRVSVFPYQLINKRRFPRIPSTLPFPSTWGKFKSPSCFVEFREKPVQAAKLSITHMS
jgi:hypothetical protein